MNKHLFFRLNYKITGNKTWYLSLFSKDKCLQGISPAPGNMSKLQ